jgi:hypothetical protein
MITDTLENVFLDARVLIYMTNKAIYLVSWHEITERKESERRWMHRR